MYSNFGSIRYFSFMVIPAVSELQLARLPLPSMVIVSQFNRGAKAVPCPCPGAGTETGWLPLAGLVSFPWGVLGSEITLGKGEGRSVLLLETEEQASLPMHMVSQAIF